MLYLVATPIGNLGDLSERAREVLESCDAIACEDTRHSVKLLTVLGISKPLLANHEHNEVQLAPELAQRIAAGERIALVSDAGTPAISDPGFRLVRECRRQGLQVIPIPGACAITVALSGSGLPSDSFRFHGFLPPKAAARKRFFTEHASDAETIILYESTHRILKLMDDLVETLGANRCVCIARELTKLHETILTGRAADIRQRLQSGSTKGEFVVLIAKEGYQL